MLGSMGIRTILSLVLGLMVLGTIVSFSTVGSIGGALQQGFDQIGGQVDFTTDVEDEETLSDLTLFVRDRAVNQGCLLIEDINEGDLDYENNNYYGGWNGYDTEEGYSGLEATRLTRYPTCLGADSGLIREGAGGASPLPDGTIAGGPDVDDNYQPGIYSREQFEISESFVLEAPSSNADTWLGSDLAVVTDVSLNEMADTIEEHEEDEETVWDDIKGALDSAAFISSPLGYFIGEIIYEITFGDNHTDVQPTALFLHSQETSIDDRTNLGRLGPEELNQEDLEINIELCEGDKGYIQGSRGNVNIDGPSSKQPLYPIIVIEESEEVTCDQDIGGVEPYTGPMMGTQIYVRGTEYGLPGKEHFELRPQYDEYSHPDFDESASDDSCSIVYHDTDYTWSVMSIADKFYDDYAQPYIHDDVPDDWVRDRIRDPIANRLHNILPTTPHGVSMREYNQETVIRSQENGLNPSYNNQIDREEGITNGEIMDKTFSPSIADIDIASFDIVVPGKDYLFSINGENLVRGLDDADALNGDSFTPPTEAGELRLQDENAGFDEMYGDLLCYESEEDNQAKWHICHEDGKDELGEWNCNSYSEPTNLGEWSK